MAKMERVFLLEVEQPDDSFFSPAGVVVLAERQKVTVYCQNSSHNLYKAAILRHAWDQLLRGVVFREIGFRLRDLTAEMQGQGWTDLDAIPAVLGHMLSKYPRHLYFLSGLVATFVAEDGRG